jgi:hypothetical protein
MDGNGQIITLSSDTGSYHSFCRTQIEEALVGRLKDGYSPKAMSFVRIASNDTG